MSKWVEVTVTITKTYAVEVAPGDDWDDDDIKSEARDVVLDEYIADDVEIVNTYIAKNEHEAEQLRRLSDESISL